MSGNGGDEGILDYSARVIDTGTADGPVNRVTNRLSEVGEGVAVVESFSHSVLFATGEGLVAFDTSSVFTGRAVVDALRGWSTAPLHSVVYTHGHVDHVGGSGAFLADNRDRGHADPRVIGHAAVRDRFDRYRRSNAWNVIINSRQFGGLAPSPEEARARRFLPDDAAEPTDTYEDTMSLTVGDLTIDMHHDRGETDDHTWAWVPDHKALVVGDLLIWVFPNAGNPQKVQRYPGEWAAALRRMQQMDAELLLPAHGLAVSGRERINRVLGDSAAVLEFLVSAVLERMNAGWTLEDIVADVRVDDDMLRLPWLTPTYDEPEFVVRNIWRQYGGWWDANPAHLKPSKPGVLSAEIAALAGGATAVARRAEELAAAGELAVACELVEHAAAAARDDERGHIHGIRRRVYEARREAEASLMAKGVFGAAAAESAAAVDTGGKI